MKERPILFSGPMVRAIIDGRKTQTRRPYNPKAGFPREDGEVTPTTADAWTDYGPCPLGQPGERLWVRETWCPVNLYQSHGCCYRADNDLRELQTQPGTTFCWRPSIHMPRWASRITLEITRVWVERVQDITDQDAFDEGAPTTSGCLDDPCVMSFRQGFHDLWQSIYGTWHTNPWVWAVEFRRVAP